MIKINCDIGERGPDHKVDIELMQYIQIANIACGGHAGDETTVSVFRELAAKNNIEVAAHLSYPDKENFGRVSMDISPEELIKSLNNQYAMLSDVKMVKLHGGLYNDCCVDSELSELLTDWFLNNKVAKVVTLDKSELATCAGERGIEIVAEAFAERRYHYDKKKGRLGLVSRTKEYASIHDCDEAVLHSYNIINDGFVEAIVGIADGDVIVEKVDIIADTICIHSDSDISIELAKTLYERS